MYASTQRHKNCEVSFDARPGWYWIGTSRFVDMWESIASVGLLKQNNYVPNDASCGADKHVYHVLHLQCQGMMPGKCGSFFWVHSEWEWSCWIKRAICRLLSLMAKRSSQKYWVHEQRCSQECYLRLMSLCGARQIDASICNSAALYFSCYICSSQDHVVHNQCKGMRMFCEGGHFCCDDVFLCKQITYWILSQIVLGVMSCTSSAKACVGTYLAIVVEVCSRGCLHLDFSSCILLPSACENACTVYSLKLLNYRPWNK